ncbi:hypothetical protein KX75_20605 [Salmonella enterica subsp. enterica]|nr:hypothetical protein [Salmonella enterica subsp. enterica serovar Mikawasima]
MTIKYIDPYKKSPWDFFSFIIYFGMMFLAIPTLALCTLGTFILAYFGHDPEGTRLCILFAVLFIIPIIIYKKIGVSYKKRALAIIKSFRSDLAFDPLPEHEFFGHDVYLGIDTQRGTIVYIAHPNSNFFIKDVLLMAFDNNSWRSIELINSTVPAIRINTNTPDIPHVTFTGKKARRIYDMISAMRSKNYQYDVSNPGYVEYKAEQAATEHGFNLILPRP